MEGILSALADSDPHWPALQAAAEEDAAVADVVVVEADVGDEQISNFLVERHNKSNAS